MEFRIADTFTDSLAKVTGEDIDPIIGARVSIRYRESLILL